MKKFDNFIKCLRILKNADFDKAKTDEVYRTGIVGQYNLTFELSWKAMREVLTLHGVADFKSGSPRDVLQRAYQFHFIDNDAIWIEMMRKRNQSVHIYDEDEIDELVKTIQEEYIMEFTALENTLKERLADVEDVE